MFRLGFRTAGFHQWPIREALRELGGAGYDGLEICLEHPECRPEDLTLQRAAGLARLCADGGLAVASVSYHADTEPPAEREANTLRAVELVPSFDTDVFIINGRRAHAGEEAKALADLERLLDALLPRAGALGVHVAIEPEPGLSIGSSEDLRHLIARRQSPNLGANLDVGHAFLTDPDVCGSIRALGPSIFHTHLEGMPAGEHRHLLPGEGDLDLVAVGRALRDVGYEGFLTVDLFAIADDPLRWAQQALSSMRQIVAKASEA